MNKLDAIKELDSMDILEEFVNCCLWVSKYIKDFKHDTALDKAYSIWEKHIGLRHWLRKHTLKSQYQLWIGKKVRASQKIPPKGGVVVFTKEKNAYTWSSSKRYAVSNTQTDNDRIKGSYLVRVYTTKDEVIFDVFGLSKFKLEDEDVTELIAAGFSPKKAKMLKEVLDDLAKDAFKEIVICNDIVNRGVVSAVWGKEGNTEGNWRFR
jgi:hypothetical protein